MAQEPMLLELAPNGLYVVPAAESFLGWGARTSVELIRIRFRLQDGSELVLPLTPTAMEQLQRFFGPSGDHGPSQAIYP